MTYLGAHLSSSGGFHKMGKAALAIGANTFQCFVRNPRGARAKAVDPADLGRLRELMAENGFGPIVAHAPYIMNPCSKDEGIRELAGRMMAEDLMLMERLTPGYYVFHPGSHVGQGADVGIDLIAELLNEVLKPEQTTTVLLETMAGKGSEIGRNFQELQSILERVTLREKMGVCLDTCHIWDGGYDIVNDLEGVLAEFDQIIGLEHLKAIHMNDSMNSLGSHKDRHEKIGQGQIGLEAMERIINHPKLQGRPVILETPNDDEGWAKEIAMLRNLHK